jgi:hypothetical protein
VRQREAPPHTIWVLCPDTDGYSYITIHERVATLLEIKNQTQ